jgi:L-lactate dehydrogenase complex protein LldG
MNSREKILNEIRANKPDDVPLSTVDIMTSPAYEMTGSFLQTLERIGGKGAVLSAEQLREELSRLKEGTNNRVVYQEQEIAQDGGQTAESLQHLHTVVLKGSIAVAENAAIWIPESSMANRLLPFICEELVVIIEKQNIVADMHSAYRRIKIDETGYGVFIAGPSKTADIEQSLVIGAHGPLRMVVFIIG